MDTDAVKKHLRELKLAYATNKLWQHGAGLSNHLGEYEAYHNIFGSHLAEYLDKYEKLEAKIASEESEQFDAFNQEVEDMNAANVLTKGYIKLKPMTVDTLNKRIDKRIAEAKGKRKMMEMEYKTNLTHVNVCQSLLKNFNDEAKSMR